MIKLAFTAALAGFAAYLAVTAAREKGFIGSEAGTFAVAGAAAAVAAKLLR